MQALYLAYMVLSGLAFAGLDLIRKLLAGRLDALVLVFFMSLGAAPIVLVLLVSSEGPAPSPGYLLPGLGALVFNFLGSLGFIYAVKLSPLSRTIPLLSLTPAFMALTAIPLLGEYPGPYQTLGIALVVIGAMTLTSEGDVLRPLRGLAKERGSVIMAGVAFFWSLSGPLDKRAIEHASVYFHATVMTAGVAAGALIVLLLQGRARALMDGRRHVPLLLGAMIAVTLALTFQLLAIQHVLVSLVEAMKRALGSLGALVLGRIVFSERVLPRQILAVVVMVAGVFFVLT